MFVCLVYCLFITTLDIYPYVNCYKFLSCHKMRFSAHWAETDYGLSAGQHAVLPEGKGKMPFISYVSKQAQ